MINLHFNLRNPFSERFRSIWVRHYNLPIPFKFLEVQMYASADIFDFFLRVSRKTDHAGIFFGFGLLGYNFEIEFYDSRHWNDETNDYEKADHVL